MVDLVRELDVEVVAANLRRVRADVGPDVEILAAIKYLPVDQLPILAAGGITVVGENRAQDLVAKQDAHGELFPHWDFIGQLQSRKVKDLIGRVRYIHSVATESALAELAKHGTPATRVLIEVNVAGEGAKSGIAPNELEAFVERCPVPVVGLMTMPPFTTDPEHNRRHFAALRELAEGLGVGELSMGTSQDFAVAVEEGATIIRLGSLLYRKSSP